jgi:hypothetical protein
MREDPIGFELVSFGLLLVVSQWCPVDESEKREAGSREAVKRDADSRRRAWPILHLSIFVIVLGVKGSRAWGDHDLSIDPTRVTCHGE